MVAQSTARSRWWGQSDACAHRYPVGIMTPCPSPVIDDVHAPVTVRIAQLTGSNDAEDRPIVNETDAWGARGLDLGANCEHLGKLYVFLSDVVRPQNSGPPTPDTDLVAHMDRSALGGHEAAGHNFVLPHAPTSLQGQPAWRYCGKCASLFFDGRRRKGRMCQGRRPYSCWPLIRHTIRTYRCARSA